jgi:prepilin-type processing-associated H-X9-DG protein
MQVQCQSNIHQVVLATINYANFNKGSLPYGAMLPSSPGPSDWLTVAERIAGKDNANPASDTKFGSPVFLAFDSRSRNLAWHCPIARAQLGSSFGLSGGYYSGHMVVDYAFNSYLFPVCAYRGATGNGPYQWGKNSTGAIFGGVNWQLMGPPLKLGQIRGSAETAMVSDQCPNWSFATASAWVDYFNHNGAQIWGSQTWAGVLAPWPVKRGVPTNSAQSGKMVNEFHGGSINLGYVDGHVERCTQLTYAKVSLK